MSPPTTPGAAALTVSTASAAEADAEAPDGRGAGLAALAVVQLMFGLFPVFGRLAMDPEQGFAPFAVATWRIGVASVVLMALAAAVYGRRVLVSRRDIGSLAGFALLGIVLNQGLFLVGLERSTPMNAGLVICLIPVFAYAVAVMAGKERFSGRRGLGVVIALLGAVPLFVSRGLDVGASHAFGNGLMALNALCYAVYLVWSKPLLRRVPPLVVVAWIYVLSLPWLPLFAWGQDLAPETVTADAWWALAYVLVFPTILAYALNSFALARVDASTTAFFVFAQPVITAVGSWAIMGERPTPALIVAGAGLFAGLALVLGARDAHRPQSRP